MLMIDLAIRLTRRATNFLYRYDSIRNNQQYEVEEILNVVEQLQVFLLLLATPIPVSSLPEAHNSSGSDDFENFTHSLITQSVLILLL